MTKSSTLDRLLAIVLALLMMVSLMPVQAFADVEETPVEEVTEQVVETPTDPAVEQTPVEQVVETPVEDENLSSVTSTENENVEKTDQTETFTVTFDVNAGADEVEPVASQDVKAGEVRFCLRWLV